MVETRPNLEVREQPQNTVELLLQEYTTVLRAIPNEVRDITRANVRTRLAALASSINLSQEQQTSLTNLEQQYQRESDFRAAFQLAYQEYRFAPIRQRILARIAQETQQNPSNSYAILRRHMDRIAQSPAIDVVLINELVKQLVAQEAINIRVIYSQPDKQQIVTQGKDWIQRWTPANAARPAEFRNTPPPQMEAFNAFRLNLTFGDQYREFRDQLGTSIRDVNSYVNATFDLYTQFLRSNGYDVSLFGPSRDWYTNLVRISGVNDQDLATFTAEPLVDATATGGLRQTEDRIRRDALERARGHLRRRQELTAELERLRTRIQTLRAAGNTTDADVLAVQITDLEARIAREQQSEITNRNMARGTGAVAEHMERFVRASSAEAAVFSHRPFNIVEGQHWSRRGVATFFNGADRMLNSVGHFMPDAPDLYNLDAGKMFMGVGTLAAGTAAAISLIKIAVPLWSPVGKLFSLKPWEAIPEAGRAIKSSLGRVFGGPGITALVTGTWMATGGDLDGARRWLERRGIEAGTVLDRVRGTETVSDTSAWLNENAVPYLQRGYSGVKDFLFGSSERFQQAVNFTREKWDALINWRDGELDQMRQYREFFDTMKDVKTQLGTHIGANSAMTRMGLTAGTVGVASQKFYEMAKAYKTASDAAGGSSGTLPLDLSLLADAGFIYRNRARVDNATLSADSQYAAIPEAQKKLGIDASLATRLKAQVAFWESNHLDTITPVSQTV